MTVRRMVQVCLVLAAGFLSCVVSLFGVASAMGVDVHFNPVLSMLYCVLPILSLPLFLLAFIIRKLVALQAILAIGYVAVYAALNWRTCASFGYCGSVASTVLQALRTHSVIAFFAAAILSIAAMYLARTEPSVARAGK
jgi:hypothetical protein